MLLDLYPYESWNFVYGWGNPFYKAGVFSFARYEKDFYNRKKAPEIRLKDDLDYLVYLSAKVLVHEIGNYYLFQIKSCLLI